MNSQDLIHQLRTVYGNGNLGLHEPLFKGNEWTYVKECIDTAWVSSVGAYVDRFEKDLASITSAKRAIAIVNGTAALHLALKVSGVVPGDEVLMQSLTFVATANAVSYCGAVPHFVDVEYENLGIDPVQLKKHLLKISRLDGKTLINKETGRPIRALVCMHTFGHPSKLDELKAIADEFQIVFIEDAAESLGSYYKGQHTGNWGHVSSLSFNGNKIVTTGGGGAILTNDEELGRKIKHISTTAKKPHPYEFVHDEIGYNYRLPNINAALGCAQLEKLSEYLAKKRMLAQKLASALEPINGVKFFKEPKDCKSNYWLNLILLDEVSISKRDEVLQALNSAGLMSRPFWMPMQKLKMFASCPQAELSVSNELEARSICVPSSVFLGEV